MNHKNGYGIGNMGSYLPLVLPHIEVKYGVCIMGGKYRVNEDFMGVQRASKG